MSIVDQFLHIQAILAAIVKVDDLSANAAKKKFDNKTKPLGSLGKLELLAAQICSIQRTDTPSVSPVKAFVVAADHGLVNSGVSLYPKEVTEQMVRNFLTGGAAMSVLCTQSQIPFTVVDAGVDAEFTPHPQLIIAKVARGSKNSLHEPAMTIADCQAAIINGANIAEAEANQFDSESLKCVLLGEMGIGNSSAAALITAALTEASILSCIGSGAGQTEVGFQNKREILSLVFERHLPELKKVRYQIPSDNLLPPLPLWVLATFGGYEIATLVGMMLMAASRKIVIVIDGAICSAAALVAAKLAPDSLGYMVFSHLSVEPAGGIVHRHLEVEPLLNLGLRLGEGTGAALVYPLLQSAIKLLNCMQSFEGAGVSRP